VTTVYIIALLCVHWITNHALTPADSAGFKRYVSTNLDNLQHHPVQSIVGSAFLVDAPLTRVFTLGFGGTLITLVLGIAIVLARLESRLGAARAYAVFTAGHIGATLIVAGLIAAAVAIGWYPEQVRSAFDFGISYGSQAALGCATLTLVPRRLRTAWFLLVITWPLGGMSIVGRLPDFATLGHWVSAGIGLAAGYRLRDFNQANHPETTLLPSGVAGRTLAEPGAGSSGFHVADELVFHSVPGSARGSPNRGITLASKPVSAVMRSSAIVTTSSP
jgi:hypothetical protein